MNKTPFKGSICYMSNYWLLISIYIIRNICLSFRSPSKSKQSKFITTKVAGDKFRFHTYLEEETGGTVISINFALCLTQPGFKF